MSVEEAYLQILSVYVCLTQPKHVSNINSQCLFVHCNAIGCNINAQLQLNTTNKNVCEKKVNVIASDLDSLPVLGRKEASVPFCLWLTRFLVD